MIDLTLDLAKLLTAGGDDRQVPDPASGLTRYRTSPVPRDAIALGSCSASSTTPRSLAAAQGALDAWRAAADSSAAVEREAEAIRSRIAAFLSLDASVGVVLAPSGTDAVYLISALALRRGRPVHHVVVGASELGGGTVRAARGEAFNRLTPHDGPREVGAPVPGLAERCSAEPLYLRDDEGERETPAQIDARVAQRVRAAAVEGRHVVLHLVAHSKTGLRAPSLDQASALQRELGEGLTVLVDAAQGRIAPHDARAALDHGFAVLFTGSKFYGGPPFSGALLLPGATDPGPLPAGLSAWFAASDLPDSWRGARASLPTAHNPGLLLRWIAALAEIDAYHGIDPRDRARAYHTFAGAVLECFGPSKVIELDMPTPPVHRLVTGLGAYPSVFSFRVHGPDGPLGADALRALHAALDSGEPAFHLGQPVSLGPPGPGAPAVLRVALSARLVTDLAPTPDAGAGWLRAQLGRLRERIEQAVRALEPGA